LLRSMDWQLIRFKMPRCVQAWCSMYGRVLRGHQIVLADGSIVQANPSTNPDLFWALKGGGSNFGIVTSFDFHTVPIKNIWFQSSIYGPDQAHALLDAFAAFQKVDDPKASVILSLSPTLGTVGLVYAAPVAHPAAFDAFYSVPVLQAVLPGMMGTVLQLNNIISSLQNPIPQR
jgi:FAD/FMN-containing dehydrogenase